MLTNRPKPENISFDDSCFIVTGTEIIYSVVNSTGYSYPKRFDCKTAAEKYAKLTKGKISEEEIQIKKRIKWEKN